MAGEAAAASAGAKSSADTLNALGDLGETLFGSSTEVSGTSTKSGKRTARQTGRTEDFLDIEDEGVERIMQQILGGTKGLASVFSGEQTAGLFNSSVSAQASGDLLAQLAGEIAKLTAKKVSTTDQSQEQTENVTTTSKETQEKEGLLDTLNPFN